MAYETASNQRKELIASTLKELRSEERRVGTEC